MGDEVGQSRGKKSGPRQTPDSAIREGTNKKNSADRLNGEAQSQIGEKLKAMYDDVLSQPIPDRFRELLDQLDKKSSQGKRGRTLN